MSVTATPPTPVSSRTMAAISAAMPGPKPRDISPSARFATRSAAPEDAAAIWSRLRWRCFSTAMSRAAPTGFSSTMGRAMILTMATA